MFLLALSIVYTLIFLAHFLGASFFVLSSRGMVHYGTSSSFLSTQLDPIVWMFSILSVSTFLFYSLLSSKLKQSRKFLLLAVQGALTAFTIFSFLDALSMIWASSAVAILCIVFSKTYFDLSRFSLVKRLLLDFVLVALFVEIASLVLVNIPSILNSDFLIGGAHWNLVELSFSNFAYDVLPFAYLLFICLGILGFIVRVLPLDSFSKVGNTWRGIVNYLRRKLDVGAHESLGSRFPLVLAVSISVVVSVLFVVFTVLPWVNPTNMLVSVDSPGYYQWLVHMRSININSALSFALANDRAVFLVLAYFLSFAIGSVNVMQFSAALLISLFCLVCLRVLRLFSFRDSWVYGVLLVPFSFQALGLIYSGYFANMLALVFVFAYFVVFFRTLDSCSSVWVFVLLGISELILFTHSWTWFIFVLTLGMFLLLEWRVVAGKKELLDRFKSKGSLIGATVIVGLVSDFVRKLLSPVSSTASVLQTAQNGLSFPNIGFLWNGLRQTVSFDLGGVFANQLLVLLMIIGFLLLLSLKSEVSNLFVSWIFVASAAFVFASETFVFDRLLFIMPSVILAGLGLSYVVRLAGKFTGSRTMKIGVQVLILTLVFVLLLNVSLRFVSNLII